jgi:hypothetical protein
MKKAAFTIFLLLPMLLSAQMLMFFNRQFLPAANGGSSGGTSCTNDVTYFYGDSITMGYDPNYPNGPTLTNRFSTLLCAQYSLIESNEGIGGSQIVDPGESDMITGNNAIFGTNISVWLAGYNDMRYYGTDAAALADNGTALESLVAWLALPTSQRVPWYAGAMLFGDWGTKTVLGGLAYSTLPGDFATFSFAGTTLLIGTARGGTGGNVTVVVDGTVTNNYSCLRTSAATGHGRDYSAGLIVFTNLADTAHTATFTAQSTGTTYLSWYAAYATNQSPLVVLCGTLKIPAQGVNVGYPYVNGSDEASDDYSLMISNAANALAAAQLNVKYVPAPVLDTNTDFEFDWVHPNPGGHLKIKNALQAAF